MLEPFNGSTCLKLRENIALAMQNSCLSQRSSLCSDIHHTVDREDFQLGCNGGLLDPETHFAQRVGQGLRWDGVMMHWRR
jgi:hypothetical protein